MTHENTCACCGKTLAFVGIQEYPARLNRANETLVHCTNLDCAMFERTHVDHYHAQACAEELAISK